MACLGACAALEKCVPHLSEGRQTFLATVEVRLKRLKSTAVEVRLKIYKSTYGRRLGWTCKGVSSAALLLLSCLLLLQLFLVHIRNGCSLMCIPGKEVLREEGRLCTILDIHNAAVSQTRHLKHFITSVTALVLQTLTN
eukprot:scaffold32221_cov17-Tisochrysis_lutea.AAC.1